MVCFCNVLHPLLIRLSSGLSDFCTLDNKRDHDQSKMKQYVLCP